tara:strand:- start:29 stop:928 length:900 start_codon:yes stop_codon:yes gene_type:complete
VKKKSIVLTGAAGQLGLTLKECWSSFSLAKDFELVCKDKKQLDVTSRDSLENTFKGKEIALVINTAAYTAVDKAESEPDQAYLLNQFAPQFLAIWSMKSNCNLIHLSTDFIFSGKSNSPYLTTDIAEPLNVYGKSKLAGEIALLKENPQHSTIIRTSWLYSHQRSNFVKSMIKLMSEKDELRIVDDQIGSPTATDSIVELIFAMLKAEHYSGVYHWSDQGSVSRYDFALAIQEYSLNAGLLKSKIPIIPISTDQYQTPAERPKYSVLDLELTKNKFSIEPKLWKERLQDVIRRIADNEK